LNKNQAIKIIMSNIEGPVISANGHISRSLYSNCDKTSNFYMIGSMGLASSIGLGVALKNPNKKVFVLDGDGNILMNLGSLTTIGTIKPKNLIHFVLDNGIHESTGGQPTNSNQIALERIAKAANYVIYKTGSPTELKKILKKIENLNGPIMILIKILQNSEVGKRIEIKPIMIKHRFSNYLKN